MPRYSNEPRQYSIPELSESYLAGMYNYAPPRTIGPKRKIGAANYGKSPLSSNPNTSRSLGLQNVSRTIDSVDKTYKEVKGVTAGLKSFLNNFGETGQGYSNWLTSVGLGRTSGRRSYGSFARNTDAVANLVDAGVGLTNLFNARGKSRQKKRGKGWDLAGLLNELRPDSYMRSNWLPNTAAAGQAAAAISGIFGPEAPLAVESALLPLTFAAGVNEILKSKGLGKSKSARSGNDGRAARAAVVRKVMQERGVSLPMASKIVKQEGLYSKRKGGEFACLQRYSNGYCRTYA